MLISQKIEQMTRYAQDAQKNIGDFLLNERQNLSDYTMQEIADATFSSKSTLVRIAKKLGFSGWNELMAALHVSAVRILYSTFGSLLR